MWMNGLFAAPNPPEEGTPSPPASGHRRRATPTSAQEEMEGITETGVLRTDMTGSDDDHTSLLSTEANMENPSRASLKSTPLGFTSAPNGVVPTSPPRMPSLGGGTGGGFFNELMELRQSRGGDDLPARLGKLESTGGGAAVRLTPVRRPHPPPPITTPASFTANNVATHAAHPTDVTEECAEACSSASCSDGILSPTIAADSGSALAGAPELRMARRHLSDREGDCQMLDLSARFADEVSLSSPRKRPRTSRYEGRRKIRSQSYTRRAGHLTLPPRILWGEEMERHIERARKARELKRLALQRGSRQAFIDSARADAWAAACIQGWWRRLREEGHDTAARANETSTAFRGHLRKQSPDEEKEERRKVLETLAASIIQIWYRRMKAEYRIVEGIRAECGHLGAVVEVAFGPPGRHLEAALRMIKDEALTSHASAIIRIMSWFRSSNLTSHACFNTPKTFLGHIVITSHPEVVFNEHSPGASSESLMKGASDDSSDSEGASDLCLYLSAKRLKNSLMAVYIQLQNPMSLKRSVLRAMRQVVVVYGQYLTHFADWQKLDGRQLADEVTSAIVGVFEVLARTDRELQAYVHSADAARQEVSLEKLYGYENVIRTAMTQLEKLEETLTRVVGAEEACARMEEARAAAQQIVGEESRQEGVLDLVSYSFDDEGRAAEVDLGEAGHDRAAASAGDRGGETSLEMLPLDGEAGEKEVGTSVTADEARSSGDREASDEGSDGTPDSLLDNEWLVHEIMMLPKGRFLQVSLEDAKARGAGPASSLVGDGTDDEQGPDYYETVTQLMTGGDYRPLRTLVKELAERLCSLTPNRPDLGEEVNEALDIDLLDQMLQKDVLDSNTIFSILRFAGERVLWLEAPARNDSTEEWLVKLGELEQTIGTVPLRFASSNPQDRSWAQIVVPQFQFLLGKVDQINVDIFNSHIRKATPVIRAHGVNFERARFVERVEAGQITLDRTRAWLEHVLESDDWVRGQTVSSTDRRSPQCLTLIEALGVGREDAVVMLLRRAYSRLLCQNLTPSGMVGFDAEVSAEAVLTDANLPETLSLDAQRIDGARQGALVVARSATLAAYLAQTLCGRLSMQDRLDIIDQLMVLLPEEDVRCEDIRIQMAQFARSLHAKSGLPPLAPQELTTLDGRVAHMLSTGSCPVLHLFYQRAVDVMHTILAKEADMTLEEAEAICRGVNLTGLGSYLLKLSEGLLVVCRHNEAVFKSLYSRIVMDSLTPQ